MNEKQLPDDPAKLKKMIIEQQKELFILEEKIQYLLRKLFSSKSEKYNDEELYQSNLFNEAECGAAPSEDIETEEKITVPAHSRAKGKRKPIPADLPVVEIIHELPEEELQCPCGCKLEKIGEERSEKLRLIPARVENERHIRYKYACRNCEGTASEDERGAVKIAPLPPALIPKSLATPSLLAYLFVSKFCDALPFYRLGNIFKRIGLDLSRQTMCRWAIAVAEKLKDFSELLKAELLKGDVIGADETTHQVIKEPDREAAQKSYMWAFRGGTPEKPVIFFEYRETRSGDFLEDFLTGFKGTIVCDAYSGYNHLKALSWIVLAACWAHVRRKFFDAAKASKKKTNSSYEGLSKIKKLYAIEKEARVKNLSFEERKELRRKKALPEIEKFKKWLDKKVDTVAPGTLLGKAINYTLKIWDKLIVYLDDGKIPIDNNFTENIIRPFVIGRKNWLFSYTPRGAGASALLYSIIENAKVNNLEPYWYLLYLFKQLPRINSQDELKHLLPQYIDPQLVTSQQ